MSTLIAITPHIGFRTVVAPYAPGFRTLIKGKGHKYIKRTPTGKPKPKYRYWYKLPEGQGIHHEDHLKVGAKFEVKHGDQRGHYEIKEGPDDLGLYILKHDETGHSIMVDAAEIKEMLHSHHKDAIRDKRAKLMRDFEAAAKHGTQKQLDRLRGRVMAFADAYLTGGQVRYIRTRLTELERRHGRRAPARQRQRRAWPGGRVPKKGDLPFDSKILGRGAYGQVYRHPGPPPYAIKYGEMEPAEFNTGQKLGNELGVGPQVFKFEGQAGSYNNRMAMEYLEGETMMDHMRSIRREPDKKSRGVQAVAKLFGQTRKMHEAGYAHNDLHSNNAMMLTDGSVKIIDYGRVVNDYYNAALELAGATFDQYWMRSLLSRARSFPGMAEDLEAWHGGLRAAVPHRPPGPDYDKQPFKDYLKRSYDDLERIFNKYGFEMK